MLKSEQNNRWKRLIEFVIVGVTQNLVKLYKFDKFLISLAEMPNINFLMVSGLLNHPVFIRLIDCNTSSKFARIWELLP